MSVEKEWESNIYIIIADMVTSITPAKAWNVENI